MRHVAKILMHCSIATIVGLVALSWSGDVGLNGPSAFVSSAEARIGRPLTPMSYAGVARRTTRRAVVGGAVVGAAAVGAATYCRQVVDAYGRVVTVC
jgi:hypothetical protein